MGGERVKPPKTSMTSFVHSPLVNNQKFKKKSRIKNSNDLLDILSQNSHTIVIRTDHNKSSLSSIIKSITLDKKKIKKSN